MPFVHLPRSLLLTCALLAALAAMSLLAGCANLQPVEWRLVGKLPAPVADPAAFAQRVEAVGGQPLRPGSISWVSPDRVSITLVCEDRGHCKRAMMRLAAQPGLFTELEREGTRRIPQRPLPATAS
jgi:hypothetical protein